MMSSKKTSSITFRIDDSYGDILRKVAEKEGMSLNTLANKIFGQYVEYDIFSTKFGMLKISTDTFRRILSKISDQDIIDLATRAGSQEAKEFILFKWKELNTDSVTDFILLLFEYCGYGRCHMDRKEGKISVSVHHDLKEKGSLYLEHLLTSLIQTTLKKPSTVDSTEDVLTLHFQP